MPGQRRTHARIDADEENLDTWRNAIAKSQAVELTHLAHRPHAPYPHHVPRPTHATV
jgi:hypothetical protein